MIMNIKVENLHSEIHNTYYVVSKTSSDLVTFLVPTNFKYPTISCVCFYNFAFLHGPYVHTFIHRSTGQVLAIRTECNGVYRIPRICHTDNVSRLRITTNITVSFSSKQISTTSLFFVECKSHLIDLIQNFFRKTPCNKLKLSNIYLWPLKL